MTPVHRQIDVLYRQAYACVYPPTTLPQNKTDRELSYSVCRTCVRQLLQLAKKSRTRLSPVMRRSICRGCLLILDARCTGHLRLHKYGIILKCDSCGTRNRTPIQPKAPYRYSYFERMLPDTKIPNIGSPSTQLDS